MKARMNDPRLRFLIGDVRDAQRMADACRGIDIVIHAAALKRVEVCEADPNEAIATNVIGTQNVARACIERSVHRCVFLSTDKAAAPNTLYGSTKLVAERVWNGANIYSAGTHTRFSTTRYGNVLGSTGSVVPIWRAQASSGRISITNRSMTRFFMSMNEAVDLVILALREMRGGEIFVPKIGSASILTLAQAVVPEFVEREEIGIRPGEKMHECLITEDEARQTYDRGTYYVIEPYERTWGTVGRLLDRDRVREDFDYRSDNNASRLAPHELREKMVAA